MALTHFIESFEALLLFSSFFLIYLNPNPLSFLEMIVSARDLLGKSLPIYMHLLSFSFIPLEAVRDL